MKWNKIQSERKWLIVYLLLTGLYVIWRVFFTLPMRYGLLAFIVGIVLLVAECLGIIDFLIHFIGIMRLVVPEKPKLDPLTEYPDVDVFIATYNEPWEIIYKTVIGCKNMDYPDPQKVHIYVLDDGHREEVRRLCKEASVGYITRDDNEHAKAGNINNALAQTTSPYIVTFDADMIPMHQFLMETLPYFIGNEAIRAQERQEGIEEHDLTKRLGFLQVPQAFYNADIFQHRLFSEEVIPNEQDYFHREVQLAKNASNSVIYSGSNTVITRQALEDVEGFVTGIITEDIATGIRIQAKGYQSYAINEVLATGLAPYDLEAIIKQRNRWARGCIQTFRRVNPLFLKGLSAAQRLNYFDSLLYWYVPFKRLIYLLAPILFTVFGVKVVDATILEVIIFWLPMYIFNMLTFKKFSGKRRTMKWTNIYDTILMPTLISAVFLETLGIKMKKFEVTAKKRQTKKGLKYQLQLAIPHAILFFFTVMGITTSILELIFNHDTAYIINLFWLSVNGYALLMALLFVLDRPTRRASERFKMDVPVSFSFNTKNNEARVIDISESGIAMVSEEYYDFQESVSYPLKIRRENYCAHVEARFIRVNELKDNRYKYAFVYNDMNPTEYEQLVLILFDRVPNFPDYIRSQSAFKDISRNMVQRFKQRQRRKVNKNVSRVESVL